MTAFSYQLGQKLKDAMHIEPRYQRNIGFLDEAGQARLRKARAVIVGAGGLGGTVLEILARYGVGHLRVVDFDRFDETNLNRQLLCTMETLGANKALVAAARACAIDPRLNVEACPERLTDANGAQLLASADVVLDCLGNLRDRFVVQRAAAAVGAPVVHAAVAGEMGQLMTIFPGDAGLAVIYGDEETLPAAGEETRRGTPPSAVAAVAALQAHEAIALLAQRHEPLRHALLRIDLFSWRLERISC